MSRDFIPDQDIDDSPTYPTVFGLTLTPIVSGVLLSLLGLAGAVYLLLNLVLPAFQRYQELRAAVKSKEDQIAQQQEIQKKITQAQTEQTAARQKRDEVLALFAKESDLDTLPFDLNRLVADTNARRAALIRERLNTPECAGLRQVYNNPERIREYEEKVGQLVQQAKLSTFKPVVADPATATPSGYQIVKDSSFGAEVNDKLKRQVVSVTFEGNFAQTLSMFRTIERLQSLLLIRDLKIARLGPPSRPTEPGALITQSQDGNGYRLDRCQPDPALRSTFQLEALLPLTDADRKQITAAAAPAASPAPK